jgi:hypothetical protein
MLTIRRDCASGINLLYSRGPSLERYDLSRLYVVLKGDCVVSRCEGDNVLRMSLVFRQNLYDASESICLPLWKYYDEMLWSGHMWVAAAALVSTNTDDYKILHCLNFVYVDRILGWLSDVVECCRTNGGGRNGDQDYSDGG